MSKFESLAAEYSNVRRDYVAFKNRDQDSIPKVDEVIFCEREECPYIGRCRGSKDKPNLKEKDRERDDRHGILRPSQTGKQLSPLHLRQDSVVVEGLLMLHVTRPSLPVVTKNSILSKHSELENNFTVELKTSGLRGVKERKLVNLFHQVCLAYHSSIVEYHDMALNTWKCHADECIVAAVRELRSIKSDVDEASRARSKAEDLAREAMEAQEKLSLDLKDVKHNFEHAVEEAEREKASQVDENQRVMSNFIAEMEAEVEKMKHEAMEEAKHATQGIQVELENKHMRSILTANNEIDRLTVENEKTQSRCVEQEVFFSKKIDELGAMARSSDEKKIQLKQVISKLKQDLNNAEMTIESKTNDVDHLKHSLKQMRQERDLERLEKVGEKRIELDNVEFRVKQLLEHKDRQTHDACSRAQQAEHRIKVLERIISDLENGFEEVLGT